MGMMGKALGIFKPRYALTVLFLLSTFRTYSSIKTTATGFLGLNQVQTSPQTQPSAQAQNNPDTIKTRLVHFALCVLYWSVAYLVLCFATVPLIKMILVRESNLANAVMIIIYIMAGALIALLFTGLEVTRLGIVMLIVAGIAAAVIIVYFAGQIEKMRVNDTFGAA